MCVADISFEVALFRVRVYYGFYFNKRDHGKETLISTLDAAEDAKQALEGQIGAKAELD